MGNAIYLISQNFFIVDNKNTADKSLVMGHEDMNLVINTDVVIEDNIEVPKAPSGKKFPEFS
jgi:hypothetical protein